MCGARNPRLTETDNVQGSDGVITAPARYVTLEAGQRVVWPERCSADQRAVGGARLVRGAADPQRAEQTQPLGTHVERGLREDAPLREGRAVGNARATTAMIAPVTGLTLKESEVSRSR